MFTILPTSLGSDVRLQRPIHDTLYLHNSLVPRNVNASTLTSALPPKTDRTRHHGTRQARPFPSTNRPLTSDSFQITYNTRVLRVRRFALQPRRGGINTNKASISTRHATLLQRSANNLQLEGVDTKRRFRFKGSNHHKIYYRYVIRRHVRLYRYGYAFYPTYYASNHFGAHFFQSSRFLFNRIRRVPSDPCRTKITNRTTTRCR